MTHMQYYDGLSDHVPCGMYTTGGETGITFKQIYFSYPRTKQKLCRRIK